MVLKKKNLIVVFLLFFAACSPTNNKSVVIHLQSEPSLISGENIPLNVALELPDQFKNTALNEILVKVQQKGNSSSILDGQLSHGPDGKIYLWWIAPKIEKGQVMSWQVTLTKGSREMQKKGFRWKDVPGQYLDLQFDGRNIIRYVYAYDRSSPEKIEETNKPFHHIFDFDGKDFITNSPGGLYPHHRGLFIGWQKVECGSQTFNFWSMEEGVSQKHQKFLQIEAGPVLAVATAKIDWLDEKAEAVITEERRVSVFKQPLPTLTLLEFRTKITPVKCDVNLLGNAEHAGFQFRAHNDVAIGYVRGHHEPVPEDKIKCRYFFHKDGIDPKKDFDLPWTALSFDLRGRKYNVQHINHPKNPSPTVYSAYRNYGRFGASFNKKIKKRDSLNLIYYIWVVEGETPSREAFQNMYEKLVNKPTVKIIN